VEVIKCKTEPLGVQIGLCSEFTNLKWAYPGHMPYSVGYHGDDGGIYERFVPGCISYYSEPKKCQRYSQGETAGIGIEWESGMYFVTRNGVLEGKTHPALFFLAYHL
jgi:hypothetical protein